MGICSTICSTKPQLVAIKITENTTSELLNGVFRDILPAEICHIILQFFMACLECGQLQKLHSPCLKCQVSICIGSNSRSFQDSKHLNHPIPRDSVRPKHLCKLCIEAAVAETARRQYTPSLFSLNIYTAMIELGQSNIMPIVIIP